MKYVPNKPVKVALVGVSGYGRIHLRNLLVLAKEGVVDLCAVTIINQMEEASVCEDLRRRGCHIYDDFHTMLTHESKEIDLCCLPVGILWHSMMTIAALKAGMNVLVEKPAAATLKEVQAMQRVRDETGLQVFVGFQNFYTDFLWELKAALLSGQYGRVKRIRVLTSWPRSVDYYKRTNWAGKLSLDGRLVLDSPINNAMAHFAMMSLFWAGSSLDAFGEVASIQSELYRVQDIESFDTFSARILMHDGCEIIYNLSHSAETLLPPEIIIETERATITCNEGREVIVTINGRQGLFSMMESMGQASFSMYRNICSSLRGASPHICDLEHAEAHTRLISAIHASADVQNIPEKKLKRVIEEGVEFVRFIGLSEALVQAHAAGELLSKTGSMAVLV